MPKVGESEVAIKTEVVGYDGAGFWRRLARGILMEPKNGGAWHGSTGRICVWVFMGLCLGFEIGTSAVPGWCANGLWASMGYVTSGKVTTAIATLRKPA